MKHELIRKAGNAWEYRKFLILEKRGEYTIKNTRMPFQNIKKKFKSIRSCVLYIDSILDYR